MLCAWRIEETEDTVMSTTSALAGLFLTKYNSQVILRQQQQAGTLVSVHLQYLHLLQGRNGERVVPDALTWRKHSLLSPRPVTQFSPPHLTKQRPQKAAAAKAGHRSASWRSPQTTELSPKGRRQWLHQPPRLTVLNNTHPRHRLNWLSAGLPKHLNLQLQEGATLLAEEWVFPHPESGTTDAGCPLGKVLPWKTGAPMTNILSCFQTLQPQVYWMDLIIWYMQWGKKSRSVDVE